MRPKCNHQPEFDFHHRSNLKVTNDYYEKYEAVSGILDENPQIMDLVHEDTKDVLDSTRSDDERGGEYRYSSDTVLRTVICQVIEGDSLRDIIIRIDDSNYLRRFVRIYNGPMLDYTTLCNLKNCISVETWKKINEVLAGHAVDQGLIDGEKMRLDTTAVETNIHWPADSAQLWDTYRVLARLIEQGRAIDPAVVGNRRLQTRKAKRLYAKISRMASKKSTVQEKLRPLYERLIELTLAICDWAEQVRQNLEEGCRQGRWDLHQSPLAKVIASELAHYHQLGLWVIDQASRRVLNGETVPNQEKIFSIFEPHTELLKRGKAAKPLEFGHMIQIQQVDGKFITDYEVFEKRPVEHELLKPALEKHKQLFGRYPETVAADKGYYESMSSIAKLNKIIKLVSIAKKGSRTEEEAKRESDCEFRSAQRFRAGVEGTISYLKRILGLFRCYNKGLQHFVCTIGAAIFTHNLLNLARA